MDERFSMIEVKTWHLYFEGEVPQISNKCELVRWVNPSSSDYLTLFRKVGDLWGWSGRILLYEDELVKKLNSPYNEIWLFKTDDHMRGFFEIDRSNVGDAEIVYLGLLPEEIGKGFGKIFLDAAIATASGSVNDRVWLHTCEYDHPNALAIYLKAGFVIKKETIENEYYSDDFLDRKKSR